MKTILTIVLILCASPYCKATVIGPPAGYQVNPTVSGFTNLSTAKATIGSNKATLTFATNQTVNNLTIPTNIELKPVNGAIITVNSGKTLTINGPFSAPLSQVFNGSGTVTFGAGSIQEVSAEWFSNVQAAATAAAGGTLNISASHDVTSTIVFPPAMKCHGTGVLVAKLNAPVIEMKTNSTIEDISINAFAGYTSATGIALIGGHDISTLVDSSLVRNVKVNSLKNGIDVNGGCYNNRFEKNIITVTNRGLTFTTDTINDGYSPNLNYVTQNDIVQANIGVYAKATGSGAIFNLNVNENNFYLSKTNNIYLEGVNTSNIFNNWYEGSGGTSVVINGGSYIHHRGPIVGAGLISPQVLPAYGLDIQGTSYNTIIEDVKAGYNTNGDIHLSSLAVLTMMLGAYRQVDIPPKAWQDSIINDGSGMFTLVPNASGYGQMQATTAGGYNGFAFVNYSGTKSVKLFSDGKNVFLDAPEGLILGNGTSSRTPLLGFDSYASNAAALAGGLTAGMLYRNGDALQIVH